MTHREIAIGGLLLIPPTLAFVVTHHQTQTNRDRQVRRAQVERDRWSTQVTEISAPAAGLTLGSRFPALAYSDATGVDGVVTPGQASTVIMVNSLNVDPEGNDLRQFKSAVDQSPRNRVLIITEEPGSVVRQASQIIRHPRIAYVSLQPGEFDRMHQVGKALVYKLDATGVIRERRIYDNAIRLPALIPALAG